MLRSRLERRGDGTGTLGCCSTSCGRDWTTTNFSLGSDRSAKRWRADTIIIEKAALGIQLLGDVSRDFRCLSEPQHHAPWCARIGVIPTSGKEERLAAQVERLYTGHARLQTDAPWLPELKRELLGFPSTTYDDQVDSVSQFLEWSASIPLMAASSKFSQSQVALVHGGWPSSAR